MAMNITLNAYSSCFPACNDRIENYHEYADPVLRLKLVKGRDIESTSPNNKTKWEGGGGGGD